MNWWGFATLILGGLAFVATGRWLAGAVFQGNRPAGQEPEGIPLTGPAATLSLSDGERDGVRGRPRPARLDAIDCVAVLLAVPALLYASYYTRLLGEPIWLYRLRALPGSELLAALAGVSAGWAQGRWVPRLHLSRVGKHLLVPVCLGMLLALPYLKPIFRPLRTSDLRDTWRDEVCLQSSGATCGPASAATILRQLGRNVSERELAVESHTSASGTENWYLARALRKRSMKVEFKRNITLQPSPPVIAGVRLKEAGNAGHFIVLLALQDGVLVVGDPLEGRSTNSLSELQRRYEFTGFFMSVRR